MLRPYGGYVGDRRRLMGGIAARIRAREKQVRRLEAGATRAAADDFVGEVARRGPARDEFAVGDDAVRSALGL